MSGQETSPQSPPANTPKHRRPWNSAEDATLRTLVGHFGASRGSEGRWKDIAAGLEGRTAKVSWPSPHAHQRDHKWPTLIARRGIALIVDEASGCSTDWS
jgi:hypothetical protein